MVLFPSLAQVAITRDSIESPRIFCDPVTGLLHEPGNPVPIIDCLADCRRGLLLETIMTKSDAEEDPNVVRIPGPSAADLATDLQRIAPDPDVIRSSVVPFVGGLETGPLRREPIPDPDIIRASAIAR